MDRRAFIVGSVALLVTPLAAAAQQAAKTARIAFVDDAVLGRTPAHLLDAFRHEMRRLGWSEGANLVVESRYAASPADRPRVGADVLALKPDVIVTSPPGAFAFAPGGVYPIRTVPIVFTAVSDPVGAGMVASLARPGGNMTGLSYAGVEINSKRLELLSEAVPNMRRLAVLAHPGHSLHDRMVKGARATAQTLNIDLQIFDVGLTDSLDTAFEAMAKTRAGGVLVLQGPHFFPERKRIADLALKHRLPASFELAEFAEAGGLMTYAPSSAALYRRAAVYTDKILRGAKPADLPVEEPTKFELVINMNTAKALGLTIPPSLLLRADQVIE